MDLECLRAGIANFKHLSYSSTGNLAKSVNTRAVSACCFILKEFLLAWDDFVMGFERIDVDFGVAKLKIYHTHRFTLVL